MHNEKNVCVNIYKYIIWTYIFWLPIAPNTKDGKNLNMNY
jgi:hypothetical protein